MSSQEKLIEIIVRICTQVLFPDETLTSDSQQFELSVEEWENLRSVALTHGVLPVVMHYFGNIPIENKNVRTSFLKGYAAVQGYKQRYKARVQTIRELAEMFAEEGIDMMVFKGVALAQLYPNPEWRVFSDIDFYLYGKYEEGVKVLKRHGVVFKPCPNLHTTASLHGILLENHFDFLNRWNHKQNLLLDDELKKMAEEEGKMIRLTFLGEVIDNVYVMTPTMNAVFLIRHMALHFAVEASSLRMLYDWILFLKSYIKDVDWNRVIKLYEVSGMMEFVGIVQGLLFHYLAVEMPECPIKPIIGKKTEKVWECIINPPAVKSEVEKKNLAHYLGKPLEFWDNRWKHRIVFPDESYFRLFMRYTWSLIKQKLIRINDTWDDVVSRFEY